MLKIPAWRTFPEHRVTAYQDDTMFWKYYLIPEYLTIRKDANGKPVFLLVAYAFGDQDREENKDLPRGGGYLVMDVEMRVDPAALDPIKEQLQKDTDELWHQLKALADQAGADVRGYSIYSDHKLNNQDFNLTLGVDDVLLGLGPERPSAPPGDAPPKIVLSDPTWSEGTFHVSAPQSTALVAGRLADGPLSLVGTNVAAANLDLTSAGADFMIKTLTDEDGTGIDLTPIQVQYQLKFWARVPPVSVHATADSRSLYSSIKSIYHDYEGNGCDDDSIHHSEQYMDMAVSSGMVKVVTDVGDPDTPQDIVDQIRGDAVKTIQTQLTDKFFDKKPAPPPQDDKTKDFVDRESDVYYLKSEVSMDFTHFEYDEELTSVRKWPVNPQGTMQAFLSGLSADEVKQFVRRIDLDDPFFQTLGLHVAVFGVDWDTDPIDFVEVAISYEGVDENGHQVQKATNAVFDKDSKEFFWDPSLIGAKREYSYKWRLGYHGHGAGEWSDEETDTTNRLTFQVATPGKVAAKFLAGNIDFTNTTKSVQIEIDYADTSHGVAPDGTTLVLNGGAGDVTYERWIFVPQAKDLTYKTTFFLKNDQEITSTVVSTRDDQVLVNEPKSDNRLDVKLIPVGDWSQVIQSVVSLRYADAVHGMNAEGTFQLHTSDEFRSWAVYTAPAGPRKFQYKVITTFKDGSSETVDWVDAEGDQPLPIAVKAPPVLQVDVLPSLIDFAVTPVVEVTLAYDDAAGGVHETETFALTKPDTQVWKVPLKDPHKRDFTVAITYNTADGRVVTVPPATAPDDKVTVPKLPVPQVNCLMVPKMVDFTATPVVEVDIRYVDQPRGVDQTETFLFTDPENQEWKLQVAEGATRKFEVSVTYNLADGSSVRRDPVTLETNKMLVPKYVPAPAPVG
jgi:hypothetical protein